MADHKYQGSTLTAHEDRVTTEVEPRGYMGTSGKPITTGIYGSSSGKNIATAASAEFIGTFLLVLAITATATAGALGMQAVGPAYGSLAMPLVNGLTLAALAVALGHISGAHLNPAVTFSLALTKRIPWASLAPYLVAQFAGAAAAALVTWGFFGQAAREVANVGATVPAVGVSSWTVLLVEAVGTLLLMTVVIATTTDDRAPAASAPLAVGFALAAAVFIAAPLTGAGINPARALGPMMVAGQMGAWWAYLLGPVLGAAFAAVFYDRVLKRGTTPQ